MLDNRQRLLLSTPFWLMLHPRFILILLAWGSLALPATAQSITATDDGTGTVIQYQGQTYQIQGGTQAGANLFHSFQQFGLSGGEIAQFLSQPEIANILGRVTGGDASVINGLIQVTGSNTDLYLMNPAGIIFGPGARLDVPGSFTATTGDRIGFPGGWLNATGANDYTNLTGSPFLISFLDQGGLILNQGDLAVNPGESISLIGGQVINTGSLTAPGGTVVITAVEGSQRVRLSQPGHLLSLELEPEQIPVNSPLKIQDLPELLTGKGIDPGFTVTPTGELQLSGSDLQIPIQGGTAIMTGAISTSDPNLAGNIGIFGSQIALVDANIAANGGTEGGTILIGGEQQGKGPVPNATHLFVDQQSKIAADGVGNGDGGRVILFASDTARIFGNLSARGGDFGGDGGFVETSGLHNLEIEGSPDVAAPQGQAGTWLIDPNNIGIGPSVSINMTGANPFTSTNDGAFLSITDLTIALNTGASVRVVTGNGGTNSQSGNITLSTPLTHFGTSPGFLSLEAHNSIFINNSISSGLSSLNLSLIGDSDNNGEGRVVINQAINTNGGAIVIAGKTLGSESGVLLQGNGSLNSGGGDISITGSSVNGSGILIETDLNSGGGNITLNGTSANQNVPTELDGSGQIIFIVENAGVEIERGSINSLGGNIRIVGNSVGGAGIAITSDTISSFGGNIDLIGDSQGVIGVISFSTPLLSSGGNINVSYSGRETVNNYGIAFSGEISSSPLSGNGGAIALTAPNNIFVTTLNSQTDTGRGGSITVTTQGFFQATGSFTARNGVLASISAAGALGGGDITITHGGNGTVPFIVGDANISQRDRNGTAAAITNGDFTIAPSQTFEGNHTLGNIQIRTTVAANNATVCPPYCEQTTSTLEGTSQPSLMNENLAQGILRNIAQATGAKPAILYAGFVPAGVVATPTVERLEANLSQGVQQFDPLQATATDVAFSLEPQENDRLQLLLMTASGSPIVETLAITRGEIEALVGRFRRAVSNLRSRAYFTPAQELYQQLIAPFEAVLTERGIDNLIMIGDEGLRSLPLAALHDGNGFLVERYSLGQMPSLSLTNFNYQPITANTPVLAMGASEFTARGLSPLPAVPEELNKITRQRRGEVYLNEQFTWRNLKAQSQERQFQILHLATHAFFDPNRTETAYIQLWGEEAIALSSLRELRLYTEPPLELLILSACTTALGNQEAELGFAGAAVQAGVKSVLASLWQVSDAGTAVLMNELYYQLAQPEVTIKAEAVRRAQLALLNQEYPGGMTVDVLPNEDFSHPFYWSAFSLVGSPW